MQAVRMICRPAYPPGSVRSGKVLQNSAGGTQTAASAHPDIPALMKQTAALPPDDLRERVTALSSADQSKRKR